MEEVAPGERQTGGDYEQGVFLRTFKTVNSDDSDDGRSTSGLRRKIGGGETKY